MASIDPFLSRARIAYFSMEIALRPEMHTYSGGLGVLAGDTARSCADLELPVVFVTLVSREGYLRQEIDARAGRSSTPTRGTRRLGDAARRDGRGPDRGPPGLDQAVALRADRARIGHAVPVLLLDTDLEQNAPERPRASPTTSMAATTPTG